MSFQSLMTGGYPTESDIDTELAALGLELCTVNNPNYIAENKQQVWGRINALRWAISLSVYPPTPTTFNVRGGDYLYKGTEKTYTPVLPSTQPTTIRLTSGWGRITRSAQPSMVPAGR